FARRAPALPHLRVIKRVKDRGVAKNDREDEGSQSAAGLALSVRVASACASYSRASARSRRPISRSGAAAATRLAREARRRSTSAGSGMNAISITGTLGDSGPAFRYGKVRMRMDFPPCWTESGKGRKLALHIR